RRGVRQEGGKGETRDAPAARAARQAIPQVVSGKEAGIAIGSGIGRSGLDRTEPSAELMIRSIISTDSIGNFPEAVSPESISASAPSKIALATSEASARVGRG